MITVGLTGGIGSGKSYISKVFLALGIPLYNADEQAARLTASSKSILQKLQENFGDKVIEEGKLQRSKLADIVFKNPAKLSVLNAIIHPAVEEDFKSWLPEQNSARYVIKEAAILFETGSYKQLDYNILVCSDIDHRIDRLILRDGISEEDIKHRMANQWSDEQKKPLADFIISNTGTELVVPQVIKIHQKLLKKSNG